MISHHAMFAVLDDLTPCGAEECRQFDLCRICNLLTLASATRNPLNRIINVRQRMGLSIAMFLVFTHSRTL